MRNAKANPIRTARLAAKLNQTAVARRCGVTTAAVSRWETGKHLPEPNAAKRLAKALPGLTLAQIYAAA